jgi:hypothetical protein
VDNHVLRMTSREFQCVGHLPVAGLNDALHQIDPALDWMLTESSVWLRPSDSHHARKRHEDDFYNFFNDLPYLVEHPEFVELSQKKEHRISLVTCVWRGAEEYWVLAALQLCSLDSFCGQNYLVTFYEVGRGKCREANFAPVR